jgi:hypothetical protein
MGDSVGRFGHPQQALLQIVEQFRWRGVVENSPGRFRVT